MPRRICCRYDRYCHDRWRDDYVPFTYRYPLYSYPYSYLPYYLPPYMYSYPGISPYYNPIDLVVYYDSLRENLT